VELVLVVPVLIVLLLLVAGFGRIAHTRGEVDAAAADAARTAALAGSPEAARQAGEQAAATYLAGDTCRHLEVEIDTSALRPGGHVTARVRCVTSLAGLGLAGFPGTRTLTGSARVPIDSYRSNSDGFTNSDGPSVASSVVGS
jgi:hypothetical protein